MTAPGRVLRIAALLAGACLSCALEARAEAPPRGLELSWTAPAGCAEREQVLAEIERLLGGDRALHEGGPLRAVAEVRRFEQRFLLELRFPSNGSELLRQIESDSCAELDEAAALVIALSLDPNNPRLASALLPASVTPSTAAVVNSSPAPAPATPAPAPEPAPPLQPTPAAPPSATAETATLVHFPPPEGGARLVLDVGTLPSVAFGLMLGAGFAIEPVTLVAQASLFLPQDHTQAGVGGSFVYGAFSVLPCRRFAFGRAALDACGLLEAGFIFASGEGVDQPEQPFTWFPRLGLGLEFGYALTTRFALNAGLLGFVTPARPRFVVEDDQELFRPSLVGARFSAGMKFGF